MDLKDREVLQIAIDGPSGAGKSTIAKAVAAELSIEYVDTGAMYRAVALKMLENGVTLDDDKRLTEMLEETSVDFVDCRILLDGRDITDSIRTEPISKLASDCSALSAVREKLVAIQRDMGLRKHVIMDGRDIGSNVFPHAGYKFYLTASPEERANRRYIEMKEKGETVSPEQVLADIKQRDYNDSHRSLNPLVKTIDAIEIDSTAMSIEDVKAVILERIYKER